MQQESSSSSCSMPLKPIDKNELSPSASDSFDGPGVVSSTAIFRDIATRDCAVPPAEGNMLCVRRANPVASSSGGLEEGAQLSSSSNNNSNNNNGKQGAANWGTTTGANVISPFPFTPTPSEEELEERDMLTKSLGWNEAALDHVERIDETNTVQVDFSRFFESVSSSENNIEIMECDDFTLSSHDDLSVSDDISLESSITRDPTSFWEQGVTTSIELLPSSSSSTSMNGSESPTTVSLGSTEQRPHSRMSH